MEHLRRLIPYVRRYRGRYLLGLALVLGASCFGVVAPYLIKVAIDSLERGATREAITWAALGIVSFALVRGFFNFAGRFTLISTARRVEFDLRNDLYRKLTRLSARYYDAHKTGDITSRAVNDLEGVRMVVGIAVAASVGLSLLLVLSFAAMILLRWDLALLSLAPLGLATAVVAVAMPRLQSRSLACQDQLGAISNRAQELYAGARIIRAFAREEEERSRFDDECRKYESLNMSHARWRGFTFAALALLVQLSVVITLYVGGRGMIAGSMTKGVFIAFTAYQFLLVWPMIALGWVISIVQRGAACMRRIAEILDAPEDVTEDRSDPLSSPGGRLEAKNLSFRYREDLPLALREVSFSIEPGWRVALVGRAGAGKTTLAHLLLRLYPVPDGTVFLDGRDVNRLPLEDLRKAVGIASQDIFLWSDRIRENILFGSSNGASQDEIAEAAGLAQLAPDIEGFSAGYDQVIGERGLTLSGGQKQRMAIARAVLRRPAVLILDDVFSSLDPHTESEIVAGLREFMNGRTSITITHRLNGITDADLILVLEEGRIVERGRHRDLLAADGAYARLWEAHRLREDLETS